MKKQKPSAKYYFDLAKYHIRKTTDPANTTLIKSYIPGGAVLGAAMCFSLADTSYNTTNIEYMPAVASAEYKTDLTTKRNDVENARKAIKNLERSVYTLRYEAKTSEFDIQKMERAAEKKYKNASKAYVETLLKDPRATELSLKQAQQNLPELFKTPLNYSISDLKYQALDECRIDLKPTAKIADCMEHVSDRKPLSQTEAIFKSTALLGLSGALGGLGGFSLALLLFLLSGAEGWPAGKKPQRKNYIKKGN